MLRRKINILCSCKNNPLALQPADIHCLLTVMAPDLIWNKLFVSFRKNFKSLHAVCLVTVIELGFDNRTNFSNVTLKKWASDQQILKWNSLLSYNRLLWQNSKIVFKGTTWIIASNLYIFSKRIKVLTAKMPLILVVKIMCPEFQLIWRLYMYFYNNLYTYNYMTRWTLKSRKKYYLYQHSKF